MALHHGLKRVFRGCKDTSTPGPNLRNFSINLGSEKKKKEIQSSIIKAVELVLCHFLCSVWEQQADKWVNAMSAGDSVVLDPL